ncbi:hypothetical protein E4Z61_08565 [Citrobacter tructae]|uniref:Uncharacterized protein n=1 Tax=Citrobacter tructae TaxID=2562449 RepID=A0ABX5T1T4_9ENTR|nr:hypothetical protein E4Z61_08565 [Citrobacter tructae]
MPVVIAIERSMFMPRILAEKRHENEIVHTFYARRQIALQYKVTYLTLTLLYLPAVHPTWHSVHHASAVP